MDMTDHSSPIHRRDTEYGFPARDTGIGFSIESRCGFTELLEFEEWDENGRGKTRYYGETGELGGRGLTDWVLKLKDVRGFGNPSLKCVGGLKVLYGACSFDSERSYRVMPFRQEEFDIITRRMRLPEQFMASMATRTQCAFSFSCADDKLGEVDFRPTNCFVFRLGIYRPNYYQMAISYDPQSNFTFALVLSKTGDHEFPTLISMLKQKERYSCQPMLLPVLVAEMCVKSSGKKVEDTDHRLNGLEETMGQHEWVNRPVGDPLQLDFVGTTRALNFIGRTLAVEGMRVKGLMISLKKALEACREVASERSGEVEDAVRMKEKRDNDFVRELVAYHTSCCQHLVLRLEYEEKRVQTQISVVYQFMAQKDSKVNIELAETSAVIARESKRDSSAMKSIAVLTMCFLPGTFLAALFAMPIFNWDEGDHPVVKSGFKYYWAVAIPLTVLVLIVWALAMLLPWGEYKDTVWKRAKVWKGLRGQLEIKRESQGDTHDLELANLDRHKIPMRIRLPGYLENKRTNK